MGSEYAASRLTKQQPEWMEPRTTQLDWIPGRSTPIELTASGPGSGARETAPIWVRPALLSTTPVGENDGPACAMRMISGNAVRIVEAPAQLSVGDEANANTSVVTLELFAESAGFYRDTLEIRLLDTHQVFSVEVIGYSDPSQKGVAHAAPMNHPQAPPQKLPEPPKHPAKNVSPVVPVGASSRLQLIDEECDFGEHVSGSQHERILQAPTNTSSGQAVASFSVQGSEFLLSSSSMLSLPEASRLTPADLARIHDESPHVVYRPQNGGHHEGKLVIDVRWGDGTHEQRIVPLFGRARTLYEAPGQTPSRAEQAHLAEAAKRKQAEDEAAKRGVKKEAELNKKSPQTYDPAFEGLDGPVHQAELNIDELKDAQNRGLAVIKAEVAKYKAPTKAEHSLLVDLAEIALGMATAGIATQLAKKVLPQLVHAVEHLSDDARAKVDTVTAKGVKGFSDFTTDVLKEGFKSAGKEAIKAVLKSGSQHGPSGRGGTHSSDAEIDFMAQLQKTLDDQAMRNKRLVLEQQTLLRPAHRYAPQFSIDAMTAIGRSFKAVADHDAEDIEANALAPQWSTFVARSKLGTENVSLGGKGSLVATKTQDLMGEGKHGSGIPVAGVLQITARRGSGQYEIVAARLDGVSKALIDRIDAIELSQLKMPIRVTLVSTDARSTILLRDEVGRVRVGGDYKWLLQSRATPAGTVGDTEADAIEAATSVLQTLLQGALDNHGIKVTGDDAS